MRGGRGTRGEGRDGGELEGLALGTPQTLSPFVVELKKYILVKKDIPGGDQRTPLI